MRNGIMMQYFEWYMDTQNDLWKRLEKDADHLKKMGITAVWIPPCFKATSGFDPGYGVYYLYDLGEFDQMGGIPTKYGTKDELLSCIKTLQKEGLQVYADVVLNHKANGDGEETFEVVEMDPSDRTKPISEPYKIKAWTKFTFPGRGDKYSKFKWSWIHFTGTDFNSENGKRAVYMIQGINKGWNQGVTYENGNFDYLMFNDIDYKHPDVVKEIRDWARWFIKETGVDGFRFDAVKHINDFFIRDLIKMIRGEFSEDFYFVGEYWNQDSNECNDYLSRVDYLMDLFDVRLHFNMHVASKSGGYYDMRKIFDGTLVVQHPELSVTFSDNHDSQPGQALESFVEPWFKPLSHAIILLRKDGYPCIFYGDYYGIKGENPIEPQTEMIDRLLELRNLRAYGDQTDYFDHSNVVGWVRSGDKEHPGGLVCIMSNGEGGEKSMNAGKLSAGSVWYDYMGNVNEKVTLDEEGNGLFKCNGGSVSVYIREDSGMNNHGEENETSDRE